MVTLLLDECELRGRCGSPVATSFISCLHQHYLLRGCRLSALFPNHRLSLLVPLVSLVGYGLGLRGGHLLTLLLWLQRMHATFDGQERPHAAVLQGLASKSGVETMMAEP